MPRRRGARPSTRAGISRPVPASRRPSAEARPIRASRTWPAIRSRPAYVVVHDAVRRHQLIPIAKPILGEAGGEAARRAILSGWITQGPEVAAFEREFAAVVGAPHACAVSNCTTALHLALLAAGVKPGDEVITVSHSFIATANAIRYCGATPVFVDIEPRHLQHRPGAIEPAITANTSAMLVRPPDGNAVRPAAHRADRQAPRASGDRRRGLRDRQRDPAGTGSGRGSASRTATPPASRSTRAR